MKLVIQRVKNASVSVDSEVVGSIGRGLLVLVGIHRDDTTQSRQFLAKKLLNLRAFEAEDEKRWSKSVLDLDLEILCVSQFTLYHTMKGNKPDFRHAMPPDKAKEFYNDFLDELRKFRTDGEKIQDGRFGALMEVSLVNDGPVTLELESGPN